MPRYKYSAKKKPAIDVDAMVAAIKEVMIDKKSQRSVAKAYNINDTKLHRYISELKSKNIDPANATNEQLADFVTTKSSVTGGRTVFSVEQEKELMKYLLHSTAIYYGLTIRELVTMAYEFAKKLGVRYPPEWDVHGQASKDWYCAFMHRHPNLSLRTPEQTSANRAKAFCAENVNAFFANLDVAMFQSGISYDPDRIWNMDETGCPTVPTKTVKVIAEKGKKRVGQKTSAERGTNVTLALAVNAAGQSIHPFFIFPKKNMQSSWMVKASPGTVGVANESGWMDSKTFVKYMAHFIKHAHASKSSPTLLLLDSHTSHLSIEVIDMATDAGITMVSFPPHCTHRMQPLDVTVFGSFKTMFSRQCQNWMKSHSSLQFYDIVTIAEQCLDACATRKNIKSGFKVTGICDYNPDVFTAEDFVAAELSGENETIEEEGDDQRVLMVSGDVIETVAHEEVTTSASEIASTPGASSMPSTSGASICRTLEEVSPIKRVTPAKKSNRGRKPMKTTILTSPENVANLRQKAEEKQAKKAKKDQKKMEKTVKPPAAKRSRRTFSAPPQMESDSEEEDFCTICKGPMPKKLTKNNAIHCNGCDRAVHLKCARVLADGYTCVHCESE